jgi:hypothetical protein
MAHYARVEYGVVMQVIKAEQDFIDSLPEEPGVQWVQTSYNTRAGVHYDPATNMPSADQSKALRKNYAGIGMLYDEKLDAFIMPQPYYSWKLDKARGVWAAPKPRPKDGKLYSWDEQLKEWYETDLMP